MHPGPWDGGPPPFFPFFPIVGGFMFLLFLLLVAASLFFLARRGTFGAPPPWITGRQSPEAEAKKTLADRFANGDISADEFMERASVLNWTPGSEQWPLPKKRRR
jgi:putative membrane protein